MKKSTKKLQWYASGGGLALSGPHSTQALAWKAMRLAPGHGGLFPSDTKVWPDDRSRAEISEAIEADHKARHEAEVRAMVTGAVRRAIAY